MNNNTNNKYFSYGEFLLKNPNATKEERREAIKKFYSNITQKYLKSKL